MWFGTYIFKKHIFFWIGVIVVDVQAGRGQGGEQGLQHGQVQVAHVGTQISWTAF